MLDVGVIHSAVSYLFLILATGDPIHPEPDLIEVMLERAMAQGATLELVRSDAAKAALAEYGPSAALLRF